MNAATVLISNYGTVPAERCADMMGMLLGASVSTGFVWIAAKRLATTLADGGYDEAVKAVLAQAEVLSADETPVEVITGNTDADQNPIPGSPHILTIGNPTGLQYLTAIGSRSSAALAAAGILAGFTGVLVRDDYSGYAQFDPQLDAVQLCNAHLLREAQGVADLGDDQAWATIVIDILNRANTIRDRLIADGQDRFADDQWVGGFFGSTVLDCYGTVMRLTVAWVNVWSAGRRERVRVVGATGRCRPPVAGCGCWLRPVAVAGRPRRHFDGWGLLEREHGGWCRGGVRFRPSRRVESTTRNG